MERIAILWRGLIASPAPPLLQQPPANLPFGRLRIRRPPRGARGTEDDGKAAWEDGGGESG
jgi:hypothetical protein